MKLGLENPKRLFQALGNPHEKYLKIQVAGTNGKGSTCAFLDSICRQANIKTGLYTSPHLVSITERIKIEGEEISEEDFARYATIVRNVIEDRENIVRDKQNTDGVKQNLTRDEQNLGVDEENSIVVEENPIEVEENTVAVKENLIVVKENLIVVEENLGLVEENTVRVKENTIVVEQNPIAVKENQIIPTFFEQITAIALLAFAEKGVELAILETGLGGRLDATTAARAEIVAITPIDYDHQQYLGETLTEIASEKVAIIRKDTKVVVAPQKREAERVIKGKCREVGVEPIWATTEITSKVVDESAYKIVSTSFKTQKMSYPNLILGLAGEHQTQNAAVAIGLAEILQEYNFKITQDDIWTGLETATHAGRLEYYQGILFDGAHNIAGAKALRKYLEEFVSQPITLIFGAMKDKQIEEITKIIFPLADKIILTKPDNPRSAVPEELAKLTNQEVFLTANISQALSLAKEFPNNLICVTGSLYLVGEAKKNLKNK